MASYTKGTNFTAKDSLVTGNPSKLVKGSEIDAELNAISSAIATKEDTTTTDTKLALKATKAGDTYTGTHNFTGGTVTVPTVASSDSSTNAASTAMVQSVAMNAALPAQTGNSGKFVTTNGTDASWAYAGIATVNSSITTNATVSGSYVYQPVAMATMGKSVTLPDATTLSTGGPQYILKNDGGYPFGIRDNAGTLVSAVAAGGIAYVTLKDASTAAGSWSVIGDNLEPGLITIDSTFSSTYASTVLAPFVALDDNTSIHFAALSSGFAAFVVDNTGKVLTTPVTVSSTASSAPVAAFKVSATSAIVFYGASATDNAAVVLTLSGSSPSLSLSVGTPATTATNGGASTWSYETFTGAPRIAQLSSTLYLWAFANGEVGTHAVSVSGATVTIGAKATIIASSGTAGSHTTYALTATTALVLYKASTNFNYAVVVSVSGTTCTVGTPAAITVNCSAYSAPLSSVQLSSTKILVADDNNTSVVMVAALTVSGTTVTCGAALTVESGLSANLVSYTVNSATRYNPHLFPLDSSRALLWYLDSSSISRAVVLSESGGTVTAGTILYRSISAAATGSAESGIVLPQGTTEFAVLKCDADTASSFRAVANKISGTTITTGTSAAIDSISLTAAPTQVYATRLSSGDYIVTGGSATPLPQVGMPVFRTNGDAIDFRGIIDAPSLALGAANTAVSGNRIVVLGNTQYTGTTVGASTYQLRLLNIEVCA